MILPLFDNGWVEFTQTKWGLDARRLVYGSPDSGAPFAETLVYTNAAGKLRMPPRTPYCPVNFRSTSTPSPQRIARQWLDASQALAREMHDAGFAGAIALDPSVSDVRQWQWLGYRAEVRYTYLFDLPHDLSIASAAVRKNYRKAERAGYTCERTDDFEAALACLSETEARQGFSHGLSAMDLARLQASMGTERCRAYLCRSSTGEPASFRIVLHARGACAVDWIAGTTTSHLRSGSTQLLIKSVLEDLEQAGASGFDHAGANIATVAASKSEWGGTLAPFYVLRANDLRSLAGQARSWARSTYGRLRGAE